MTSTEPRAIVVAHWHFTIANIPTADGVYSVLQLSVRGMPGHVRGGESSAEYHFPPGADEETVYIILGGDGQAFVNSLTQFVAKHPEVLWTGDNDK